MFSAFRSLAALVLVVSLLAPASATPFQAYRPYQAVYDLELKETRDSADVMDVVGRLVFRLQGDTCSGYITESRFVMQMLRESGSEVVTDIRTSNWEAGDGSSMRFFTTTRMNGQTVRAIEGSAEKRNGALVVRHKRPEEREFRFQGETMFPMQFHRRLMEALGQEDERFLTAELFDGGEEDGSPVSVTAVLGNRKTADDGTGPGAPVAPAEVFWPVSMAYFDGAAADSGPDYMVNFQLAPDGIERGMTLDYGDFSVEATLENLELGKPARSECR